MPEIRHDVVRRMPEIRHDVVRRFNWCPRQELNLRPLPPEGSALSAELRERIDHHISLKVSGDVN